jgi:hypothetical protein
VSLCVATDMDVLADVGSVAAALFAAVPSCRM